MSTAEKIITLRKSKGLSQEDLAELAGVNLRTIQRIESSESIPRGHTLKAIAKGLNEPVEDLLESEKRTDKQFLQLLNLSALTFLVFPLMNVVIPMAIWINKRDQIENAGEVGKRIINFQILWTVTTFFAFLIVLLTQIIRKYHFNLEPGLGILYVFIAAYIFNVIMILHASLQIKREEYLSIYPLKLSII